MRLMAPVYEGVASSSRDSLTLVGLVAAPAEARSRDLAYAIAISDIESCRAMGGDPQFSEHETASLTSDTCSYPDGGFTAEWTWLGEK